MVVLLTLRNNTLRTFLLSTVYKQHQQQRLRCNESQKIVFLTLGHSLKWFTDRTIIKKKNSWKTDTHYVFCVFDDFTHKTPIKACPIIPSWTWQCRANQLTVSIFPESLCPSHDAAHIIPPWLKPLWRKRIRSCLWGDEGGMGVNRTLTITYKRL